MRSKCRSCIPKSKLPYLGSLTCPGAGLSCRHYSPSSLTNTPLCPAMCCSYITKFVAVLPSPLLPLTPHSQSQLHPTISSVLGAGPCFILFFEKILNRNKKTKKEKKSKNTRKNTNIILLFFVLILSYYFYLFIYFFFQKKKKRKSIIFVF